MPELNATRVLVGVEDILLDATSPSKVTQNRGKGYESTTVTKIHAGTIPYAGKYGNPNFVSIKGQLDNVADNAKLQPYSSYTQFPTKGETNVLYYDEEAFGTYYWRDGVGYYPLMGIGHRGKNHATLYFWDDAAKETRSLRWYRGRFEFEDNTGAWNPLGGDVRDASTTVKGIVELATSAEVIAGTDATRAVTPSTLKTLTASASRRGLVELATLAELNTGTDTTRAVTPAGLASYVSVGSYTGVPPLSAFGNKDIVFDRTTGISYWNDGGTVTAMGGSGATGAGGAGGLFKNGYNAVIGVEGRLQLPRNSSDTYTVHSAGVLNYTLTPDDTNSRQWIAISVNGTEQVRATHFSVNGGGDRAGSLNVSKDDVILISKNIATSTEEDYTAVFE